MTPWDEFFNEKITKIFNEKKTVVDVGGGLRIDARRNNRYDPRRAWIRPLAEKVDYKVLDPVPDFNPDIVGDIHNLPFADNSLDAITCLAVLEHVENPIRAVQEIRRALKPGGYCFIYVPFLFYYHAEVGYYKDYWRFTEDILWLLGKPFASCEIMPVRGAIETWLHISPLGRFGLFKLLARICDRLTGKIKSRQVSGYNVFLVK